MASNARTRTTMTHASLDVIEFVDLATVLVNRIKLDP